MDTPPSGQTATYHAKIGRKAGIKYVKEQTGVLYRGFPIGDFAFVGSDFPVEIERYLLDRTGAVKPFDAGSVLGAFVSFVIFRQAPVA
jgi:hypothetical protein